MGITKMKKKILARCLFDCKINGFFNNYDSVISQNMFFTILFAQRCADSCINHCFYYVFQAWEELNGYAILCIALFLQ